MLYSFIKLSWNLNGNHRCQVIADHRRLPEGSIYSGPLRDFPFEKLGRYSKRTLAESQSQAVLEIICIMLFAADKEMPKIPNHEHYSQECANIDQENEPCVLIYHFDQQSSSLNGSYHFSPLTDLNRRHL